MKAQNGDELTPYQKAGYNEKSLFYCNQLGIERKVCRLVSEQGGVIHVAAANGAEVLTTLSNIRELPRDSDGYYIWDGGAQPVPDEWRVEANNGSFWFRGPSDDINWPYVSRFRVLSTGEDVKGEFRPTSERLKEMAKDGAELLLNASENDLGSFERDEALNEDWCKVGAAVTIKGARGVYRIEHIHQDNGCHLGMGRWFCRTELEPCGLDELVQMGQDMGEYDVPRTAEAFLHQAAALMAERGKEYDKPTGERSTGKAVHAFNAITGRDLSEAEGWLLMSLVKRVRQYSTPKYHKDSAEDAVAYAALEAEALERGE